MATAGDGRAPYESGGAGGKFRKRPSRRSAPATPYDRPPTALRNNNRGLFTKLVDPASRLIYAGAHKLFGVFRKRLPPLSLQGPPEINEEPMNISKETGQNNSTGVSKLNTNQDGNSSATGISDLEQMLKQKSFTRSEIEHLTALLHSRTTESPSDNNPVKRIEASTSGSLKIYEKSHTAIKTPVISSRVLEEKTPSPADLAKAYMGSKPTKLPQSPLGLIQDSNLINNTTTLQTTLPKNGFLTPRSRGRSAMYSMARTPYTKSPLIFNQKEIMSSSESLKRRSSVLDDDFGSGGPLRRTRQKPNLLLSSKRELGYTAFQESMLLRNSPEENRSNNSNPSVPTKSTETATKIFQQLEKLSPKKSPTKLTSNMLHGQALRSLEKVELPKFVDTSKDVRNLEVRKSDSEVKSKNKGKEKVEENGERKFPVPFSMLTSVNGDVGVSIKENVEIVKIDKIDDSSLKIPDEPPQKKRAFQMSVTEDSWELDDDDDDDDIVHVNGHVSFSPVENNKPETSLVPNKPVVADVIEPVKLPEASKTLLEVTPVAESQKQVELKEAEKEKQSLKSDGFPGGNLIQQETGFKFPSTFTTQTNSLSQSIPQKDEATPTEKVSPFQFSSNEVAEFKPKESSESKPPESTSVFSSITKNDQFKVENGNDQKSDSLTPAVVPSTSTSGIFSFASSAKTSTTPAATPDSTPSLFSSSTPFPPSDSNTNSLFKNNNSNTASNNTTPVFSFGSIKPTTSVPETVNTDNNNNTITEKEPKPTINTALSATPSGGGGGVFGFSSPATTSSATTSGALFGFSAPAATASTTSGGGGLFGFSAPATSTTTSGGSLFGSGTPATTSTTTPTPSGGALFGFSSPATTTAATPSGGALFGFSAPAATSTTTTTTAAPFGFSAPAATSTATTTGGAVFGFSAPAATSTTVPFQFGTTATSSEGKSGTSVFGSSWQPPQNPPTFSFGASPTTPITFGASNTTASSTFSFTNPFGTPTPVFPTNNSNNDQMSMEDSMAEDAMQTPSPTPISPFGQPAGPAPGFMFGQAAAVPTTFQFGGQPSLPVPAQNPFQSSSVEFNGGGGGSFSLGSTGGEKSARRIVKINKSKNRRK